MGAPALLTNGVVKPCVCVGGNVFTEDGVATRCCKAAEELLGPCPPGAAAGLATLPLMRPAGRQWCSGAPALAGTCAWFGLLEERHCPV